MKKFFKNNVTGLLLLILVIFISTNTYFYANWSIKDKSTYLYIFSTLTQSFATLIGLLATFLIFTITYVDNKRSDIGKIIINIFTKYKPGRYPSPLKLGDFYLEKDIRPNFKELNVDDYNDLFEDYKGLKDYRNYLINYSLYPLILFSLVFIISLAPFLFTDFLFNNIKIGRTFCTALIAISVSSIIELIVYIINVVYRAINLDREKNKK